MARRAAKEETRFGVWRCEQCGKEERATAHQMRAKYCSRECVSAAYSSRMSGKNNPNYTAASEKLCEECGCEYHSYQKGRKYCSSGCYWSARKKKPRKKRKPRSHYPIRHKERTCEFCGTKYRGYGKRFCSRACLGNSMKGNPRQPGKKLSVRCRNCGKSVETYKVRPKKYCSKDCFVEDGGPVRAGDAAIMAIKKYGAKKDANHNEVFGVVSSIVPTHDLSGCGFGVPDGVSWVKGAYQFFDVKNPETSYGRRGLNERQKEWSMKFAEGPVFLLYTSEDAENFALGKFDGLKRFPDERKK